MNLHPGLRILAVLACVAASTAVLIKPELFGGPAATAPAITSMLVVGHH
jgi:hypothetical protein